MRNVLFGAALFIGLFLARPMQACQECNEYYAYQSETWCKECRYSNCGSFECEIRAYAYPYGDYCLTKGDGCFESGYTCGGGCADGGGCVENPTSRKLDDNWRLLRVRVGNGSQPTAVSVTEGRRG